ncbi:hypothetical protein JCM21714_3042 [Gracilibacillus boraciitolerans JCM 21714]|uniref:Tetratricopeptide repeat protein n=1 Tax=Gracilibacillus boraciitolerans JCM 21714 TaxID=1298598 RepID=W4VL50_9BACI|nr:hypothetical protein [Gracilibacillus boraciitolerans]GAE93922.1 hypothetical protein JCM21714_3042 [Gracilibacillus boraciitolerans JCM 21714]
MGKNSAISAQFEEGKKLFMKGTNGDKKAVRSAYDIFLKLRNDMSRDALLEAYYGSTLALIGRDAVQPIEKADKAQEGLDTLNQAVTMEPNQKEIRLLRANVCLRLPESFFHCSQTAIDDFSFLLAQYQADPNYLSKIQVTEIIKNLSTAYQHAGRPHEAKEVLQRLSK